MATRVRLLFVTLSEFAAWLRAAAEKFEGTVILYRGHRHPLELWSGQDEHLAKFDAAFMTTGSVDLSKMRSDDFRPGEWGWIDLPVPHTDGDTLFMVQPGAKSDWWDSAKKQVFVNDASIKLFERIWRVWRKQVMSPIWVGSRTTGTGDFDRSVYYSKGAEEWVRRGGRLMQKGTLNVVYKIQNTAP